MTSADYLRTVRLLLAVAPAIFRHGPLALKGGTALNLFLRDMPRLSVDLDVVLTDHRLTRDEAFAVIAASLDAAKPELAALGCTAEGGTTPQRDEVKLYIQRDRTRLKVEVNHVFRGTVLPVRRRALVAKAQAMFQTGVTLPLLHPDELYGSKLVAALDRQHPRDLFDVRGLYASSSLTPGIVECFVCYLAGHNRPVHEVLSGRTLNMAAAFTNEFTGMANEPVSLDELHAVRQRLFTELPARLTGNHRAFLLRLVRGEPDWPLMTCPHLAALPALRWKLENLHKLRKTNAAKFLAQVDALAALFEQ